MLYWSEWLRVVQKFTRNEILGPPLRYSGHVWQVMVFAKETLFTTKRGKSQESLGQIYKSCSKHLLIFKAQTFACYKSQSNPQSTFNQQLSDGLWWETPNSLGRDYYLGLRGQYRENNSVLDGWISVDQWKRWLWKSPVAREVKRSFDTLSGFQREGLKHRIIRRRCRSHSEDWKYRHDHFYGRY